MDIASTGFRRKRQIQRAQTIYLDYFFNFIWEKGDDYFHNEETATLGDFTPFRFVDSDTLAEV